ncbi:uncharacterized protein EDB91DRAFT_1316072 [Suillus paluster]|uniref:uncharacterized protein n=1 Tax=Suillus paluster TaxID=48578 RepID=UPI001B871834|nr:uncharacterized protein EDB91DRAFT_1316072 [Suillus paluster]KAG1727367.1 hypothetical protein EDB91DRAFT_1316072 [Suillus paluster]
MNNIAADPALEAQPNFESNAYAGWLNALVNAGVARADALTQMIDGWRCERQERIDLWQEQLEEENECHEAEKKKPKINDFDANTLVADVLVLRPSQFALQKIKNVEYMELWYFSPDGCRDAFDSSRSSAEDAFGLTKVDGFIAFKPISSFKASQKALQDHDLLWHQFDIAKTSFLVHIEKCAWPEKHQQVLALFFMLITNHKHRMCPRGEKTLLCYVGLVHWEWHNRLAQNQGFNISIFNGSLYSTLSDDIWEAECDEGIRLVHLLIP